MHCESRVVRSLVRFRPISGEEAGAYWASGEPRDKAGGYGIQGLGAVFVAGLNGSYSAVVGPAVCETAELLGHFGIPCWQNLQARNERRTNLLRPLLNMPERDHCHE